MASHWPWFRNPGSRRRPQGWTWWGRAARGRTGTRTWWASVWKVRPIHRRSTSLVSPATPRSRSKPHCRTGWRRRPSCVIEESRPDVIVQHGKQRQSYVWDFYRDASEQPATKLNVELFYDDHLNLSLVYFWDNVTYGRRFLKIKFRCFDRSLFESSKCPCCT